MRTCARVVIEEREWGRCVRWLRGEMFLFFLWARPIYNDEKRDVSNDVYALVCLFLITMGLRVCG